jgi:hypothetical protein
MDHPARAATKGRRSQQVPPVLHATAPHLDSTVPPPAGARGPRPAGAKRASERARRAGRRRRDR